MGAQAVRQALQHAGLGTGDIDGIVSACGVMEQAIPCQAVLLQRELGLGGSGVPAFDVNATCLGFVVALELVASLLALGRYRRLLIVCSDVPSADLDPNDPITAPLFGDGAVVVLVERSADGQGSALLASALRTYGDGAGLCQVPTCGTGLRLGDDVAAYQAANHFQMQGKALYREAARRLPGFLQQLLQAADMPLDALDVIVPHQASGQALDHLQRVLGLPPQRLVRILHEQGNQLAASLPMSLHQALCDGRLQRGGHALLIGTGAGLALGGAVLRY
ncbi:MAG: 3-oxoacyl-[acyl-carrier-protein] synthase 3 [Stenotrophomonas maltophilia]|uniref:3-oxoacyl-[acyl-carrier-protein] synthase 3 n=1 Tax=Stenotrophomonas maltophilia TaxID=40324 RepID=A0A7V8FDT8_STEMA|nr:MAG: 3-oxoacyl-[acyl-carrier-protein] synthase 3 [Stenotrophomonas maltophilia]